MRLAALRRNEARAAQPQRARSALQRKHGQAGTTRPCFDSAPGTALPDAAYDAVDGDVQCVLGTAPQAREASAGLMGSGYPFLAQSAAAREMSHLTPGAAQAPRVLSPRYPLYSDPLPWDELAVLHPPCHDILMIHEEELFESASLARLEASFATIPRTPPVREAAARPSHL